MRDSALRFVVQDYRERHRDVPLRELDYFRLQPTDEAAVTEAAMCRMDGKRLSHQRRIPRGVLNEATRRLLGGLEQLRHAKSFAELFDRVEATIEPIHGIGELAVYDIALRIGARYGKEPEEIYLHAGTRAGARALGLDGRRMTVPMADLPKAMQSLSPREAEDVLCIYKDVFRIGFSMERVARCGGSQKVARGC